MSRVGLTWLVSGGTGYMIVSARDKQYVISKKEILKQYFTSLSYRKYKYKMEMLRITVKIEEIVLLVNFSVN